jgi:CRISPR/Cas system endoribonuclease Cas6 (RAMP superfamily)
MPLHSLVELQLESVPGRRVLLNNAIHGLIHLVLTLAPADANAEVSAATRLHEAQRQALSLRGFELVGSVLRLEIVTLSDDLTSAVEFVFQAGSVFGREADVLRGVVLSGLHRVFSLEALSQRVRVKAPARHLRLEFLSPTAFTHKRGTWASPHPSLLFLSLLARWQDFSALEIKIPEASLGVFVTHYSENNDSCIPTTNSKR